MKSIVLILPYFGKWPVWLDAYLLSIAKNPTIDWLIVTDCEIPKAYPENITFKITSLKALNKHVNQVVKADVPLTPRKFCDLKPAYGDIFSEYIANYDFWGFCDMDIIWGNIRKYVTQQLLEEYEIISTLEEMISGHFTLFKNTVKVNSLYKEVNNYTFLFEQPRFMWFDEQVFSNFLKENKSLTIKVFWDKEEVNKGLKSEVHQEYFLDRWFYKEGAILDLHFPIHKEHMYLHFINWKRTMKSCEITYSDQPDSFYISYSKIHYQKHNTLQKMWNRFTNLFDGYQVREYRRIKNNRVKSFIRRVKRKFQ